MATDTGEQAWKAKYAQLSSDIDTQRRHWETHEKILCRAIVRLTMATQGLDTTIDNQLTQIRDLVRKGVHSAKLLQQLDQLTESIIRIERQGKPLDAALLFQFLEYCATDEDEKADLRRVRGRFESGQLADAKALFFTLSQLEYSREKDTKPSAKTGILNKLFGGNRKQIDAATLRRNLIALLDNLEIPAAEQLRSGRLKERLLAELDADNIEAVLNDLVGFLWTIKTNIQKEQREIEEFLANITDKLTEMEIQADGVAAMTSEVAREGEAMNTAFSGHMEELRSSAQGATDLTQLKGLLHSRLDAIARQISGYRQRETKRVKEMEQQLQGLTSRLQSMELEAGELRTKLRVAHHTALIDSLTALPNRAPTTSALSRNTCAGAVSAGRFACWCGISTTSKPSTTVSATAPATRPSPSSATSWPAAFGKATSSPATAAKNSSCCWPAPKPSPPPLWLKTCATR